MRGVTARPVPATIPSGRTAVGRTDGALSAFRVHDSTRRADDPEPRRPGVEALVDRLVDGLLDALVDSGAVTGSVTQVRIAGGPMMARIAVSTTAGEHLLLDVPRHPSAAVRPAFAGPAMDRLAQAVGPRPADLPATVTAVAAEPAGTPEVPAWLHRTPWPAAMLAEVVTGTVAATLPEPGVFADLGALLARLHTSGLAVEHRMAPPVQRMTDAPDDLAADQYATAVRILETTDPVVPVHGQPALGHVLVPVDGSGKRPGAALTGWSDRLGGSAALDLGHLLGDITEIAVLVSISDRMRARWLQARAADVRDGYRAAAGRHATGATFWQRVTDGALMRVLDHRATLCRLLGPDASPVRLADRLASHLSSPAFREKGFRP